MKTFKEFRNGKKNLRKRSSGRGGNQDDGNHSPKIQQVQGEKGCRIGGSTRMYYLNQEQTRWRQVKTPLG